MRQSLRPFSPTSSKSGPPEPTSLLQIDCLVQRQGSRLSLSFCLSGDLTQVLLPSQSGRRNAAAASALRKDEKRKDELWKSTCFEAFIAPDTLSEKEGPYWELNVSPRGEWNVYRFDRYRQGQRPENRISQILYQHETSALSYQNQIQIDLQEVAELHGVPHWSVGITAVVTSPVDGGCSYWALTHCGSRPDFHRAESFSLKLASE